MYNLTLHFLYLLSSFRAFFYSKNRQWINAQNTLFKNIKINYEDVIWVHCSSVGEYQTIKPLIPKLKSINPRIHITFFSPSGYNCFQDQNLIHQVSYLPIDIYSKMKKFIQIINPMIVIVVKNDIWPNMITILNHKKIPVYLMGLKLNSRKTKYYINQLFYKKYISKFQHNFCQDKTTFDFLNQNKINQNSIIGDMRINQIMQDLENKFHDKNIIRFINNYKTIIYGSVEKCDYEHIIDTINNQEDVKHIIIPHEINNNNISELKKLIKEQVLLYSKIHNASQFNTNIMIIDQFGILKHLYKYSDIAYIGGGFSKGVHNTLEAAAYGNLMLFGPNHNHFPETLFFIKNQIAKSIKNKIDFNKQLKQLILTRNSKERVHEIVNDFVKKNQTNMMTIMKILKP